MSFTLNNDYIYHSIYSLYLCNDVYIYKLMISTSFKAHFVDEAVLWSINDDSFSPEIYFSATIPPHSVSLPRVTYKEGSYLFFERLSNASGIVFSIGDLVVSYQDRRVTKVLMVLGGLRQQIRRPKSQLPRPAVFVIVCDINRGGILYRIELEDGFNFKRLKHGLSGHSQEAWTQLIRHWISFVSRPEIRSEESIPPLLSLENVFKNDRYVN